MMRGVMTFQVPDDLFEQFLQWIRDFDTKHPGCEINMFGETKKNAEAMKRIFEQVKPGFPFVGEFKLKDDDH